MKRQRLWAGIARVIIAGTVMVACTGPLAASRAEEDAGLQARHLAERAQQTLETFASAPEMDAFRNLIGDARGVFIAPQVLKGAFIFGASGGSGIFVARDRLRNQWAGPAFYTVGSVSFGLQIGGNASEVILLVMTDRGVNALLQTSAKLGADVGAAVGPVGVGAAASTANLSADILSFSRSKGLYGGLSVDGAIVKPRADLNDAYYRVVTTPSDILMKRSVSEPHARSLLDMISRIAGGRPLGAEQKAPPPPPSRIEEETLPPPGEEE